MDVEKAVLQYMEAEEVSMGKLLGGEPIKFKEYICEDGIQREIIHRALPVTTQNLDKLYECLDRIEKVTEEYNLRIVPLRKNLIDNMKLLTEDPENKKTLKDAKKYAKEVKESSRIMEKTLLDIRLDIAMLVFSRTEETTKDKLKTWLDPQQLIFIERMAQGLSFPPKRSPGKEAES